MTKGEKLALVVAGGFALGLFLAGSAGAKHGQKNAPDHGIDVSGHASFTLQDDLEAPWLCQPSDMKNKLERRHPLYRRPHRNRPHHAQLAETGWQAWYMSPPSEETQ